jgi:hypothetical protein
MNLLKNIFSKKNAPIQSYDDFWNWFQKHEKDFFNVVKSRTSIENIEKLFFDQLTPKLDELKEGYFFLSGMYDDNTAELILTADGNAKQIVFVEELVNAAPKMDRWKITAHKAPTDEAFSITMGDYEFNSENISFYSNELDDYPDEIDISIIYHDLTEQNRNETKNGVYIFLDNYLGEMDSLMLIDNLKIIGKHEVEKKLVPITKLKDFLNWRQKEFIEKYEGVRYDAQEDEFSIFEADLQSGNRLVALIKTELLDWDSKASHPWISILTIKYDGSDSNGMPDDHDFQLLDTIEDNLLEQLKDKDGCLYIGRQTADSERKIYFACNDIRKQSKVFYGVEQQYAGKFEIEYAIYKDKYWQSFERFQH